MPFPDSAASGAANPQPPAQDTQRLIELLGNLMPVLQRIQSQAVEPSPPFTPGSLVPDNPMLDHQAAVAMVEDIIADSLRMLSGYLDTYAGRFPGLDTCVALVTEAAHRFAAHDYAQSFGLIWQSYRVITALRAGNPQLPAPRAVAPSAAPGPTTQLH